MTIGISPLNLLNEVQYLTAAEYINAPTAIDYSNLVSGGDAGSQIAELNTVLLRTTSFMDEYLNQSLNASLETEQQRVRITPEGYIALHPFRDPCIVLESFQYGSDPNNLITLTDCSKAWFEPQQIIIPLSQMASTNTNVGPLSFGSFGGSRRQVFTKYTYVAGYTNTTFAANASASATSFTVLSAAGIVAGLVIRIFDGKSTETVKVDSTYVYGSTTVPLTSGLIFAHSLGVALGNLPNAVKQAAIFVATAFIKARGDSSMAMAITTSANPSQTAAALYGNDLATAITMLDLYRRVR